MVPPVRHPHRLPLVRAGVSGAVQVFDARFYRNLLGAVFGYFAVFDLGLTVAGYVSQEGGRVDGFRPLWFRDEVS